MKSLVKLFKTPLGLYFYDANKNQIIEIQEDVYDAVERYIKA